MNVSVVYVTPFSSGCVMVVIVTFVPVVPMVIVVILEMVLQVMQMGVEVVMMQDAGEIGTI